VSSPALLVSVLAYTGLALLLAGALSVARPLRFLRIRTRRSGLALLLAGALLAPVGAWWPWPLSRAGSATRLDAFLPEYQFVERHETRVRATPGAVYRAVRAVTADEIRSFRLLTWIRRGGRRSGGESILEPAGHRPILEVATRSGFVWLADEPPQEIVVGAVVCCRPVKLESAAEFRSLTQPGFAKAGMSFRIEDVGSGYCRVTTETRIVATDDASRRRFGLYWSLIYPGSSMIRHGWLAAIRRRGERAPPG
jgi:hypothetical protein